MDFRTVLTPLAALFRRARAVTNPSASAQRQVARSVWMGPVGASQSGIADNQGGLLPTVAAGAVALRLSGSGTARWGHPVRRSTAGGCFAGDGCTTSCDCGLIPEGGEEVRVYPAALLHPRRVLGAGWRRSPEAGTKPRSMAFPGRRSEIARMVAPGPPFFATPKSLARTGLPLLSRRILDERRRTDIRIRHIRKATLTHRTRTILE